MRGPFSSPSGRAALAVHEAVEALARLRAFLRRRRTSMCVVFATLKTFCVAAILQDHFSSRMAQLGYTKGVFS